MANATEDNGRTLLRVVETATIEPGSFGLYRHRERLILVAPRLSPQEYRKTLLHELIHHMYGDTVARVSRDEHWRTAAFAEAMIEHLDDVRSGLIAIPGPPASYEAVAR